MDSNFQLNITIMEYNEDTELDEVVDISSQTAMSLVFSKPDKTSVTKTPSLTTDGTDGKIYYQLVAADLDVSGIWRYQAFLTLDTGPIKSDIGSFRVYPNLA